MSGIPVVVSTNGFGIAVTNSTRGAAAIVATNGYGIPVVVKESGGMPLNISGLTPPVVDPVTFYDHATTTGMAKVADTSDYCMGVVLTFADAGYIDAISVWKPVGAVQTFRLCGLYTTGGVLLSKGLLGENSTEPAAGNWVTVSLGTPVAVTAGQTLVAAITVWDGGYAAGAGAFTSSVVHGDITAPSSASVSGNGRFNDSVGTNLGYPASTSGAASYYVDVRYYPGASLPATIPSGYPSAGNTGTSGSLTAYAGPSTISTPGTTVQNQIIAGSLLITAANVTIKNCRVVFGAAYGIDGSSASATGLIVEDCEIYGNGVGDTNSGILGRGTFRRNNIHNCENGIALVDGASTVRDNYIHDLSDAVGDPHYDGISVQGGQNGVLIEHNTIIGLDTSCIFIKNDAGTISNVTVNNNVLIADEPSPPASLLYVDESGAGGAITNVTITNNLMSTSSANYWTLDANATYTSVTGNVNAYSGLPF